MVSYSDVRTINIAPINIVVDLSSLRFSINEGEKHLLIPISAQFPGIFRHIIGLDALLSYQANPNTAPIQHPLFGALYLYPGPSIANINDVTTVKTIESVIDLERYDLTFKLGADNWIGNSKNVLFRSIFGQLNALTLQTNAISAIIMLALNNPADNGGLVLKLAGNPAVLKLRLMPAY